MGKIKLKTPPIEKVWESSRDSFINLLKAEFDELARSGKFARGPLKAGHSRFMQEFGPYSPGTWVFGELEGGKLVCVEI